MTLVPSCIIDVRVTDTDTKSNAISTRTPEQRRHFTPFVVSTDGLIGKEAKTLLKKLSSLLAEKWAERSLTPLCVAMSMIK
jgi:hypothetical protein